MQKTIDLNENKPGLIILSGSLIGLIKKLFKDDKNFLEVIEMYEMFKKIDELRKERIGEFRKNVALRVMYRGKEININLEQLKIYADNLEKFISTTKQFLLSK